MEDCHGFIMMAVSDGTFMLIDIETLLTTLHPILCAQMMHGTTPRLYAESCAEWQEYVVLVLVHARTNRWW